MNKMPGFTADTLLYRMSEHNRESWHDYREAGGVPETYATYSARNRKKVIEAVEAINFVVRHVTVTRARPLAFLVCDAIPIVQLKESIAAKELFMRIMQMTDNAGATDEHRALNYLAVRYPAIYAKAAEEFGHNFSLIAVEVRPSSLSSVRKIVDAIFSYTNMRLISLRSTLCMWMRQRSFRF